jgi:hypothetical protein
LLLLLLRCDGDAKGGGDTVRALLTLLNAEPLRPPAAVKDAAAAALTRSRWCRADLGGVALSASLENGAEALRPPAGWKAGRSAEALRGWPCCVRRA